METIGKRLQRLRKKNGMTLREVAELMGVPVSTYRDWEYGKAIQGEPYIKFTKVFNVNLHELLTGEGSSKDVLLKEIGEARERLARAMEIARALL